MWTAWNKNEYADRTYVVVLLLLSLLRFFISNNTKCAFNVRQHSNIIVVSWLSHSFSRKSWNSVTTDSQNRIESLHSMTFANDKWPRRNENVRTGGDLCFYQLNHNNKMHLLRGQFESQSEINSVGITRFLFQQCNWVQLEQKKFLSVG